MARPKEFDRYKVLRAAIAVFREKSYSATSVEDLLTAMDIGRQSFYDTFGDKLRLYIEALTLHFEEVDLKVSDMFAECSSPLATIKGMIFTASKESEQQRALGAMSISAVSEFGTNDPDITRIAMQGTQTFKNNLMKGLSSAKEKGEVCPNLDESVTAEFIITMLTGMRLRARAGCDTQTLHNIAVFAAQSLCMEFFK